MRFKVKKTHYFSHTVHYCCSSMLHLSEAHQFLQRPTIQCVVIGRIPQAWDRNVTPPTVLFRRDDTKQIKPTINEAFVAFSGDIITDYNDLYCLFTWRDAAFVIREITNNKHFSKQLKTCVWTFAFTTKHSISRTWRRRQQQYDSENNSSAFFHCV